MRLATDLKVLGLLLIFGAVALAGATAALAAEPVDYPALPTTVRPNGTPVAIKVPLITREPDFGTSPPKQKAETPAATPVPAPSLAPEPPTPPGAKPFRIGYLPRPEEGGLDETLARRLVKSLLQDANLLETLKQGGFGASRSGAGAITIQAADGFNDLANWLEQEKFDLAFCPAYVFAMLRNQGTRYRAILQERRSSDTVDARGAQVWREGVVFVGPTSSLYLSEELSTSTLRRILSMEEFCVPSAYDATGFFYPLFVLAKDYSLLHPSLRFCGSSREVVKHVVSGLGSIGACDKAALEQWLANAVEDSTIEMTQVQQIIIPFIPTDPVILRDGLHPSESDVGKEIKDALKRFFQGSERFDLEKSRDENYDVISGDRARYLDLISPKEGEQ